MSSTEITVVDAYGKSRSYTLASFGGRRRVVAVSVPNAPYRDDNAVSWNYDSEMHLTDVGYGGGRTDRLENFNSRGYPGKAYLAYGTAKQRTVAFTWHPLMNVPLTRSEASVLRSSANKVTTWDYDDPGASGNSPALLHQAGQQAL